MFKFTLFALLTLNSMAQVPELPDLKNWKNLTPAQKEEAGAFFLFHGWAKDGLIGPSSGICINYTPGDSHAGTKAKVSFGVNEQFDTNETNSAQGQAVKQNLDKVLTAFKTYLDKGCKEESCKHRKVTLRGFADAQRNLNPEDHEFAKKFEAKYGDITKFQGTLNPEQLNSMGLKSELSQPTNPSLPSSASPNANTVLALRRAMRYAGPAAKFTNNIEIQGQAALIGEKIRDQKGRNAQGVDCQTRRQAVVDVEFTPPKIAGKENEGEMGLNLMVTSKPFINEMALSGALQVAMAMDKANIKDSVLTGSKSDAAKVDRVIEEILKAQNLTDPKIIASCKNYGTRAFVIDSSRRIRGHRSALSSLNKKNLQEVLTQFKRAKGEPFANSDVYTDIAGQIVKDESVVVLNSKDHDLLNDDGFSTSVMDCFSSKEVVASTITNDTALKKDLCRSPKDFVKDGQIKLTFDTKQKGRHVIGCNGCSTGHAFEPDEKGEKKAINLDRYYGRHPARNAKAIDLTKHSPYSREELDSFGSDMEKLSTELLQLSQNMGKEKEGILGKSVQEYSKHILRSPHVIAGRRDYVKLEPKIANYLSEEGKQLFAKREQFLHRLNNSTLTKDQQYLNLYFKRRNFQREDNQIYKPQDEDLRGLAYYEEVLFPGVMAQRHLKENDGANLTFAGLKNASYYVVENCSCSEDTVVDLIAAGKGVRKVSITSDPLNSPEVIKNPERTCIFTPPIPASCNYSPKKEPINTESKEAAEDDLEWVNAAGDLIEQSVGDTIKIITDQNAEIQGKLGITDCAGDDYQSRANELLKSVSCKDKATLPSGNEALDCNY